MNWSLVLTALFWILPLLFAPLVIWLQNRLVNQRKWLRAGGWMLAGYALLGTYQTLSVVVTNQIKAGVINEETVQVLSEPAVLKRGEVVFRTRCVTCHGARGEGAVGPNLTDDHWLYGGSIRDIFRTIRYGIPNTPMTGWKHSLSDDDQQAVANFVYSLNGTNPPNSKPPQGFVYVRPADADGRRVE